PGHILHFDFGVKEEGYCADLQRIVYFPLKGENEIPFPIIQAFNTVRKAIQSTFEAIVPGKTGTEIDKIARSIIVDAGYPEYMHATGHQLGQLAHDGGALIGPEWERYGKSPTMILEPGQVFTLELGIEVPEHGYVGLEEDILITETGAIYLSQPQTDILVL
ncbi:MAG: M24 family metallopeptidase, partial [Anaerolineaceae bacterium]|nr:M24 family metallopeptidase [Anaerolineaceae bacterium]